MINLSCKNLIFKFLFLFCLFSLNLNAQTLDSTLKIEKNLAKKLVEKKWFESMSIRGYTQIRYNRLLETNPDLGNEQGDKSWGKGGGFFIRRMRVILFGQVSKNVYFYIQPSGLIISCIRS